MYNWTKNEQYQGTELPQFIQDIAAAGGLCEKTASNSAEAGTLRCPPLLNGLHPRASTYESRLIQSRFLHSTTAALANLSSDGGCVVSVKELMNLVEVNPPSMWANDLLAESLGPSAIGEVI